MQPAPQKSKSYGSLAILGILGLALWHPGLSSMAKPSTMNITVAQNTPITLRLEQSPQLQDFRARPARWSQARPAPSREWQHGVAGRNRIFRNGGPR